ncbi:Hypothetical predicted protein [Cloeon dipterum]|uniref:FHF complex subunit HOOK-interacting protein C-terminal domain-containing protein n=1 Tax=Cloeon dipterum TaxID=197152 RepID=A0A8S1D6X9_9INSE|nr:Hypothetical predicted protein [Cloeon dipterum]
MLGRISAALQTAVDTIAPPVPLLQDFIYHWKQVMRFYDTKDDELNVPIESTHLPIHLEQMLTALQEEQDESRRYKEGSEVHSGPCLEYLIQHRVPDLLASLTVADTPSGMRHLGLVFFSRLTSLAYTQLLSQPALHEPIQKIVKMCGQTAASPTEAQEVRLLCVLAAVIGQKPDLASLFCKAPTSVPGSPATSATSSQESTPSPIHEDSRRNENLIIEALLKFIDSADGRLRVKTCESLLVLTNIASTAHLIAEESTLAETVALRLAMLHCEVPPSIEPSELEDMHASWGMDNPLDVREPYPGCRQLAAYLSWWNFCDKMVGDSLPEIGRSLVSNIQDHFLVRQLQTRICAGAELASNPEEEDPKQLQDSVITLVHVGKLLRECKAPLLRTGLSHWIAGVTTHSVLDTSVRDSILRLLEVAHGDLAVETMRLMEVMVDETFEPALQSLIFSHFAPHKVTAHISSELEVSLEGKYQPSLTFAPKNVQATLEGFLQLLPPFLRTGETEAGYETYLQDAQRQYQAMWKKCLCLGWPLEVVAAEEDGNSSDSRPEDEHTDGVPPVLKTLFNRIETFPEQEYELNLQLTSLLSRLAILPHAGLYELLLSPGQVSPTNQSPEQLTSGIGLAVSLRRLALRLAKEAPSVSNLQKRLRSTRNKLLGDPSLSEDNPNQSPLTNEQESLLESIVVLEEFCKELSAITFVKYHLHSPV